MTDTVRTYLSSYIASNDKFQSVMRVGIPDAWWKTLTNTMFKPIRGNKDAERGLTLIGNLYSSITRGYTDPNYFNMNIHRIMFNVSNLSDLPKDFYPKMFENLKHANLPRFVDSMILVYLCLTGHDFSNSKIDFAHHEFLSWMYKVLLRKNPSIQYTSSETSAEPVPVEPVQQQESTPQETERRKRASLFAAKFESKQQVATPVVEEPAAPESEPVVEEQAVPEPVVEEQAVPEPVVEEPAVPEPVVEEQAVPEPVVEEQAVPEPVVEEQAVPEPEPVVEEQAVPEPVVEEPSVSEPEPVVEEQAVPEPVVEEQAVPEPVVEEQAVPEPVVEEPSVPEPVVEEPAVPEPEPTVDEPVASEEITIVDEPVRRRNKKNKK